MGIKEMFSALFATGEDVQDYSDVKLSPEQEEALASLESAETKVEEPINKEKGYKSKGLRKKYEAPDIKVIDGKSQENLEKMTKILKGEKEEKEIGE